MAGQHAMFATCASGHSMQKKQMTSMTASQENLFCNESSLCRFRGRICADAQRHLPASAHTFLYTCRFATIHRFLYLISAFCEAHRNPSVFHCVRVSLWCHLLCRSTSLQVTAPNRTVVYLLKYTKFFAVLRQQQLRCLKVYEHDAQAEVLD